MKRSENPGSWARAGPGPPVCGFPRRAAGCRAGQECAGPPTPTRGARTAARSHRSHQHAGTRHWALPRQTHMRPTKHLPARSTPRAGRQTPTRQPPSRPPRGDGGAEWVLGPEDWGDAAAPPRTRRHAGPHFRSRSPVHTPSISTRTSVSHASPPHTRLIVFTNAFTLARRHTYLHTPDAHVRLQFVTLHAQTLTVHI